MLQDYDDRGRIVSATVEELESDLVDEVVAAVLAGETSLAAVETNDKARGLSLRVRSELVALGRVSGGAEDLVALAGGSVASAGDYIQARQNARPVKDTKGVPISNRTFWSSKT